MSKVFSYVKSQFKAGNFSESDLVKLVERKVITEQERLELIG